MKELSDGVLKQYEVTLSRAYDFTVEAHTIEEAKEIAKDLVDWGVYESEAREI